MAKKPKDIWDVVEFFNNVNRDARVASGDVEPAPGTGEYGLRTMGRGVSTLNDSVNPYANTTKQLLGVVAANPEAEAKFAKSLAKDVAITAAGFGVGKSVGMATTKLAPTISPELAALRNYLTKQQVILHGSPLPVKGNQLIPVAGSQAAQDVPAVFSLHPEYPNALSDIADYSTIPFSQRGYVPKNSAGKTVPMDKKLLKSAQGNVIIGRTPKSNLLDFITGEPSSGVGVYKSTQPIDIVERVSAKQNYNKYIEDALQALKRQGVGTKTETFLNKYPRK